MITLTKLKRFLKNWRFARSYGSSRRKALQIALRGLRRKRDYGIPGDDLIDAYRSKHGVKVIDEEDLIDAYRHTHDGEE